MKHLREAKFRQQTIARRMGEWAEPTGLRVPVPTIADYLVGFVRAAAQTLAPSSVREFFRELDANDRVLSRLGWALLLAIPIFATLALIAPASVAGAAISVNPWIKPIKFSYLFFDLCFYRQPALDGIADTKVAAHAGSPDDRHQCCTGNFELGRAGVAQWASACRSSAARQFPCPDHKQHGYGQYRNRLLDARALLRQSCAQGDDRWADGFGDPLQPGNFPGRQCHWRIYAGTRLSHGWIPRRRSRPSLCELEHHWRRSAHCALYRHTRNPDRAPVRLHTFANGAHPSGQASAVSRQVHWLLQ